MSLPTDPARTVPRRRAQSIDVVYDLTSKATSSHELTPGASSKALSHLTFDMTAEQAARSGLWNVHFHQLREFALEHAESRTILSAID